MQPGFDLDLQIAIEVMGFTEKKDNDGKLIAIRDEPNDYDYFIDENEFEFNPSEDIGDAFLVVERMKELDYDAYIEVGATGDSYSCEFAHVAEYHKRESHVYDSMPMAICLAALKVVGVDVDE